MSNIWSRLINLAGNITGTLPVANGGTGLTAGTNGGVLGYTATGTLASSALLTNHGVVLGQGASATPVATAAGTTGQLLVGVNSGDPGWSNTVGNATNFQAGVLLNTSNNTNLNVYEEYTGTGGASTGAITTAGTLKVTRIGRLVTVHVPLTEGTVGSATNSFSFGETLPSRFRPATEVEVLCLTKDAGVINTVPGGIFVGTSGVVSVYKTLTTSGNYTLSQTGGLSDNFSITYYTNN